MLAYIVQTVCAATLHGAELELEKPGVGGGRGVWEGCRREEVSQ